MESESERKNSGLDYKGHMGSGETGEGKRLEGERNPGMLLHIIINLLSTI